MLRIDSPFPKQLRSEALRRWDPLEWHLGMGTGLTLTVGSFIHGCAA